MGEGGERGEGKYVTFSQSLDDTDRRTAGLPGRWTDPQTHRPTDPQIKRVLEELSLQKKNIEFKLHIFFKEFLS